MGISSSKTNFEERGNMNLEIGLNTVCPIRNQFFYSHIESLSKCVSNITGFDSNSASPSDIFRLTLNNPKTGIPQNAIMKLFLCNDPYESLRNASGNTIINATQIYTPVKSLSDVYSHLQVPSQIITPTTTNLIRLGRVNFEAQVYELVIYLEKIKKLIDFNICPYFVKVLGGNINVKARSIWEYLLQNNHINIDSFIRNITLMRFSQIFKRITSRRPSINNTNNTNFVNFETEELINSNTPGLPPALARNYLYERKTDITYNITNIDKNFIFNNTKCGYILTEEIKDLNFLEILYLFKILDIVVPPQRPLFIILTELGKNLENNVVRIPIELVQNFQNEILNLFNSFNAENKKYFVKSKLSSTMEEIFNILRTDYISNGLRDVITAKLRSIIYLSANTYGNVIIKKSIFQILVACYSLLLSGVAHNDLHAKNIFMRSHENFTTSNYVINDIVYTIENYYSPKLYDFDRSYAVGYNNISLNNNNSSQNNILLDPKDFIKILPKHTCSC